MGQLDGEVATYNRMREDLEANHHLEWVVIHGEELAGIFEDFQDAAKTAVKRFGRGPYLIRQVGRGRGTLPAAVVGQWIYVHD